MTRVVSVDFPEVSRLVKDVLAAGELVVLPTDTVYGVGCRIDAAAIERVFEAKQRPVERAVPVLLSDADAAQQVVADFPHTAWRLAIAFWPGPLTLVLPRRDDLPANLSALPTVGIRVPDHAGARRILAAAGGALAVTSANRSDQPPACTVQAAIASLADAVALYVDGGRCPGGVPSTVVLVEGREFRVLRPGPVSENALRSALGIDPPA
jgi:L-threonylcarbamoyladenylate synthase